MVFYAFDVSLNIIYVCVSVCIAVWLFVYLCVLVCKCECFCLYCCLIVVYLCVLVCKCECFCLYWWVLLFVWFVIVYLSVRVLRSPTGLATSESVLKRTSTRDRKRRVSTPHVFCTAQGQGQGQGLIHLTSCHPSQPIPSWIMETAKVQPLLFPLLTNFSFHCFNC